MSEPMFQRNTHQREVILQELCSQRSHPTAAELYALVRVRLPKISLGTVYRNLDRMAQAGMIQKLELAGTETRFDGDTSRHDHLRCVRCGRIDDLPGGPRTVGELSAADTQGYQLLGHRLEFRGFCPQCASRQS